MEDIKEGTKLTRFDFGHVIRAIKDNKKACRQGWNGKDMWLELIKACDYQIDGHNLPIKQIINKGESTQSLLPFIMMKTADNKYVPWLASQTDVLAEDWIILD